VFLPTNILQEYLLPETPIIAGSSEGKVKSLSRQIWTFLNISVKWGVVLGRVGSGMGRIIQKNDFHKYDC
jgi:hypothetical protein